MTLAPKTKLLVGLGAFMLIIFGLLSLSGHTFSGDLTSILIPQANPQLCAELQKACTDAGGKGVPCDNHAKLCSALLPTATSAASQNDASNSQQTNTPRRRTPNTNTNSSVNSQQNSATQNATQTGNTPTNAATHGAAPEQNPPKKDTTPPTGAADLKALQELYPDAPSQGQIDSSTLR